MKKLAFDPLNIVICGIGGQGNVLASEIVGNTLCDMGYHVAVGETYGASQRGGSVMSHVRVSETEELGVLIPSGEAHIIIGFEPLETLRMARRYAGGGTVVIYDPRPVYPQGVLTGEQQYPDIDGLIAEIAEVSKEAHTVKAADIAMSVGDSRAANIALLGAFSTLESSPISKDDLKEVISRRFKGPVLDMNMKAFELGASSMEEKGGAE